MVTEWVNITAAAFYGDYTGYIRYANQVLNITGAMSSSSANGLRVFSIEPNTHYRVTMVMQNRFRLGCVPNLTSGQTVTNYVFDPLDTNGAANQGTSRTLEITSGANQIYLCVGAWSSGAGDTLENTLATIVVEVEQEVAIQQYTVTFTTYDGTVLKTELVNEGADATPPADPVRDGYRFVGWSADTSNVTADMTVSAVYARNASPLVLEVCSGSTPVMTIPKVTAATLRDSLEGELTLSFSTLSRLAANVETGQTVRLGDLYFNIVRVQKSIAQGMWLMTVTCEHITYILNDDAYTVTELDFTGSPSSALAQVLAGTPFTVGTVEYSENVTLQINQECTRRAALMQLIALLGGEIEYEGYSVNIRVKRGNQTAKELMESRNVTNVGVTHDSRSATASYEIAFYSLIDIAVGDLVHIVFAPLGINVHTRIICLEYNPFHPYNARVEIGDYVPSINENLFRADTTAIEAEIAEIGDALAGMQEQVDELANIKQVLNIEMDEGTFTVTYTDSTTAQYTYFTDSDGKIVRITTGTTP